MPSGKEKKPTHNHRRDYFETLGHKFDRYADGFSTHVEEQPDGKGGIVREHPSEVPHWVVLERDREKKMLDFMEGQDK